MKKTRFFLGLLVVLSLLLFFLLIHKFLGAVIFALLTAFFSKWAYDFFLKKLKKGRVAMSLTWIGIVLFITLPVLTIASITFKQGATIIDDVKHLVMDNFFSPQPSWPLPESYLTGEELTMLGTESLIAPGIIEEFWAEVQSFFAKRNRDVDFEWLTKKALWFLQKIAKWLISGIYNITLKIPKILTSLFIYIFLTSSLLIHWESLKKTLKKLIPLAPYQTETYFRRIGAMTKSMFYGTFLIAVIQGLISGISLLIAGVPYSGFLTLLICFVAIIPLFWAGIITVPIWIILLITGNVRQGIMILLVNLLIVGNIDNILRPLLTSKDAKINDMLLLLALIGGTSVFWVMGIFYGPIAMVAILTSLEFYLKHQKIQDSVEEE